MIAQLHGCCLVGIPDTADDGANWTCEVCGTRWVYMTDRGRSAFYRAKETANA